MKRVLLNCVLSVLVFSISCVGSRNISGLTADSEAMALIRVGKRYMGNQNYEQAISVFRDASQRPFNQFTTMATYLHGLANYYQGNNSEANQIFDTFIERFPQSKYFEDAQYHKALVDLRSDNYLIQERGLNRLLELSQKSRNNQLAGLAENQVKQFLFYTMDPEKLERYVQSVDPDWAMMALEAQAYRMVQSERLTEAKDFYDSLKRSRRESSDFLDRLLDERRLENVQKNSVLKIALFLPFNVGRTSVDFLDEIPTKSRLALDFYEGFLTALERYEDSTGRKVYVKVFDTQEDTLDVQLRLMELNALNPQGIVGGYQREVVEFISNWAEKRQIPYFIPFSPYSYLVKEKLYSFLLSPSIEMHGRRMAEHAYQHLGLRKVAVWSNQERVSNLMAQGFQEVFEGMGGQVMTYYIDSVFYERAEEQIPEYVMDMKDEYFDGVYIPINNDEESANLILSLISKEEIELVAMGSPRWRNYEYINTDLKETYQLHITTTNIYSDTEEKYRDFYYTYLKNYFYPPSDRSLQGFSMGKYYLSLYGGYKYNMPFSTFVKENQLEEGIQQSFFFGGGNVNQYVNIAKFADGILVKQNKPFNWFDQVPVLEGERN